MNTDKTQTRITGVDIPFTDLVALLVKLAIAAIPATIILAALGALIAFSIMAAVPR